MRYKAIPTLLALITIPTFFPSVYAQPQIGEKTPTFVTSTLDSRRVVLKEYWEGQSKKVVVLSFFATWCQPCKEDLRYLQKVQDEHKFSGLQVLAVLTQDSSKERIVKEFLQELNVNLTVLTDEYGIIGKRYAVTALPCNFVINKDGVLMGKYYGYSEDVKRRFEGQLRGLLLNP